MICVCIDYMIIMIEYPHEVPYVLMRSASGIAGSLLIPCIYQVAVCVCVCEGGRLVYVVCCCSDYGGVRILTQSSFLS